MKLSLTLKRTNESKVLSSLFVNKHADIEHLTTVLYPPGILFFFFPEDWP